MSTGIAAAIFLPLAPVGMFLCYLHHCRTETQRKAEAFAEAVEVYIKVRNRG